MEQKISIIGGDLRIVNLAKVLAKEEWKVYTYALEKAEELTNFKQIESCETLQEALQKADVIVSSIPLSQDGMTVMAPFAKKQVKLDELQANIKNKKFIAGKLDATWKSNPLIEAYDILEIEEYAILNAIATAEGAIQIAMEEFPKTISGSNILVMGFGRIGKIVAKMLQGIGANVYCEARKKEDLAYIKAYGYQPIALENLADYLGQFDVIINNIPVQILDQSKLDLVKKEALILDLASKPGGVDFEYAKKKQIKTIWALALPGKVAPVSAAEYIKEIIYNIMKT